jgi:NAD(P)-dependent dehydrogenase (short-subunit alcohol dehydrogenase family)
MLPIDLSRKRALVTGGDTGLGAATSMALAEAGAAVAIAYRGDIAPAEALARDARQLGVEAEPLHLEDIADPACVAAAFAGMDARFGGIDILVNNAGIDGKPQLCADSDPAAWHRAIEVDLVGPYHCAREAVRRMLPQKSGVVINVTSVHELIPWSGYSHYTAAKAGLSMFTRTLAQETAGQGIRVLSIAPGAIKTPINANVWGDPKGMADLLDKIPMNRLGEPADVGRVIAFLCSDLASYMTGSTVVVDGGMLLYPGFRHGG